MIGDEYIINDYENYYYYNNNNLIKKIINYILSKCYI